MKKVFFAFITTMFLLTFATTVSAISLSEKEDIYRVDEFVGNSLDKEYVINWLIEDDNFIYHLHETSTEEYISRWVAELPLTTFNLTKDMISGKIFSAFETKDDYYDAIKDILLSYLTSEDVLQTEEIKEKTRLEAYAGFTDNLIKYGMKIPDYAKVAADLKGLVVTNQLETINDLYENFENAVQATGQQKLYELLDDYVASAEFAEYLKDSFEVISAVNKGYDVAKYSYDLIVELEAYNNINDRMLDVLQYLYLYSDSEDVSKISAQILTKCISSKKTNLENVTQEIWLKIAEDTAEDLTSEYIKLIVDKLEIKNILAYVKLGITFGNLYSDQQFSTSDIREQLTMIEATNEVSTTLANMLESKLKLYKSHWNSTYGSYDERANDAEAIIYYSKLLLATRQKGEKAYYLLKDTAYSSLFADGIDGIFSLLGMNLMQDKFGKIEDWYKSCCEDFETAKRILYNDIDQSMFENLYEEQTKAEDFVIVDGKLIAYNGSEGSPCVPYDVHTIGTEAFNAKALMTQLTIRGTTMETHCVANCGDLYSLYIPKSVTTIQEEAIYNCPNVTIYGYKGTVAEAYAHKYDIPFVAWGDYANNNIWDGSIATKFFDGRGTEKDPYKISSASELAYLAKIVNEGEYAPSYYENFKYFELTNDIYLNDTELFKVDENIDFAGDTSNINAWTPIGNEKYNFKGHFNGNGYSIKGLYINSNIKYAGLFGKTGAGTIQNIRLTDSYIQSTYNLEEYYYRNEHPCIGGFVGYAGGIEVYNLTNDAYVKATSKYSLLGGIVGYNAGRNYVSIELCVNNGTIYGTKCNPSGIVGENYNGNTSIVSCVNNGDIKGGGNSSGISNNGIIKNCENFGNINVEWDQTASGGNGIASGITQGGTANNCYNYGNIKSNNGACGIGGSENNYCYNIGNVTADYTAGGIVLNYEKVNHCYNEGIITAVSKGGSASGIGGGHISNSFNLGNVYAAGEKYSTDKCAGISAYGYGATIDNCYNKGNIYGCNDVSGIGSQNCIIINCINYGNVSGTYNISGIGNDSTNCVNNGKVQGKVCVGGITGEPTNDVHNCINNGEVIGEYDVGGIVGRAGSNIYNCINNGHIVGMVNVGGISGIAALHLAEIWDCTNTGKIEGGDTNIGGIVGELNTGKLKNCINTGELYISVDNIESIDSDDDFRDTSSNISNYNCYNVYVGGIVGHSSFSGYYYVDSEYIVNCENEAHISVAANENIASEIYARVGGIIGFGDKTNIIGCVNRGNINCEYEFQNSVISGISGDGTVIHQCYNEGGLYNTSYVAGIAYNSYVCNSYNIGELKAEYVYETADGAINCYNIGKIIGSRDNWGRNNYSIIELGNEKMKSQETYKGFDFKSIWMLDTSDEYKYPQLRRSKKNTEYTAYWDGTVANNFEAGDGSEENPFVIENPSQLAYFAKTTVEGNSYQNQYIILSDDIYLNNFDGENWISAVIQLPQIRNFEGIFDGKEHALIGIYAEYDGLFYNNSGTIKNVKIGDSVLYGGSTLVNYNDDTGIVENCQIIGNITLYGVGYVGGIVRRNDGIIENCYNKGEIRASGVDIGGIAGINDSTIKKSYNEGDIFGSGRFISGICGKSGGKIIECYNKGKITNKYLNYDFEQLSGIVGENTGNVEKSYNAGNIESLSGPCAGIVSENTNSGLVKDCYNIGKITSNHHNSSGIVELNYATIKNCYTLSDAICCDWQNCQSYTNNFENCYYMQQNKQIDFGVGLTQNELKLLSSFKGFDFSNVWGISPNVNNGYPYLLSHDYIPEYEVAVKGSAELVFENGKLMVNAGNVTPENISFTYEWYRNGELTSITENGLDLTKNDIGAEYYAKVTSKYCNGTLTTNTVNVKEFHLSGIVNIIGKPYANATLTVNTESILPQGAKYDYQWYCDGYPMHGETNRGYVVSEYDIGCEISVKIVGTGVYSGEIESESVMVQNKLIGTIGDKISWLLDKDSKTLTFSGSGTIDDTGALNQYTYDINHLVIEEGITKIADYSFGFFYNLQAITIPMSVANIGEYAFDPSRLQYFTVHGYKDSYAEIYAKDNNIEFVSLGDIPFMTVTAEMSDNNIDININCNKDVSDVLVHAALYTPNGKMLKWCTATKKKAQEYGIMFNKNDFLSDKIGYVKVYAWDSLENLQPLGNSVIINLDKN